MTANSNAKLVNAIANGEGVQCPKCGALCKTGSRFCTKCGVKIPPVAKENKGAAFAPVAEKSAKKSTTEKAPEKPAKYTEPSSAFAEGLPGWDIIPPQVMVRRHK